MTTLLELIERTNSELALTVPTSVFGSTNNILIQMRALMNAAGNEMLRKFQWQAITKEYRFTTQFLTTTGTWTTAAATVTSIPSTATLDTTYMATGVGIPTDTYIQSVDSGTQVTLSQTPQAAQTGGTISFAKTKYSLPADYDRKVNRTDYDKSKRWEMMGPESAQQWQFLKSSYISTGPRIRYRILGNYFQIWPMTVSSELLGFEYVSKYWVTATGGTAPTKTAFSADTDTCIYNDNLIVTATKLKFYQAKQFNSDALRQDYLEQLNLAQAHDAANPMLSLAPRAQNILIGWENIPDSNYGG